MGYYSAKNKKVIIGIAVIAIFIAAQWLMVRLVYAHKLSGTPAQLVAAVYKLKAGTVEHEDQVLNIYLKDFFNNQSFIYDFLDNEIQSGDMERPSEAEVNNLVWDKLVKNAWVESLARAEGWEIDQEELNNYLDILGGEQKLREVAEQEYNVSFDKYKDLVIVPGILQEKVYYSLLNNYEDHEGVARAEEAYNLLESGEPWEDVAETYSSQDSFVGSGESIWLYEDDLAGIYEPVKDLSAGDFSKIVQTPWGYVIWHLQSINPSDEGQVWEVRGLYIAAKTMDAFLADYLSGAQINRIY